MALSRASAIVSADQAGVERTDPCETLAVIGDDSDSDTLHARDRERLDLAGEHLDVGLARSHGVGLDLFTGTRRTGDAACELQKVDLGHAAVPPTVMPVTRSVG